MRSQSGSSRGRRGRVFFLAPALWCLGLGVGPSPLTTGAFWRPLGLPVPSSSGLHRREWSGGVLDPHAQSSLHCFLGGAGLLELVLRSWIWGWVGLPGRPGTFSFGSCHLLTYLSRPVRSASAGPLVTESTYLGAYGGAGGPVQESPAVFSLPWASPQSAPLQEGEYSRCSRWWSLLGWILGRASHPKKCT